MGEFDAEREAKLANPLVVFDKIVEDTRADLLANVDKPVEVGLVRRLVGNFYRTFMRHHGVGIDGDPLTLEGLMSGPPELSPDNKTEHVFTTVEILFRSGERLVLDKVLSFEVRAAVTSSRLAGVTCHQHREARRRLLVQSLDLTQVVAVVERSDL